MSSAQLETPTVVRTTHNGHLSAAVGAHPGASIPPGSPSRAGLLCWNEDDYVSHVDSRLIELAGFGHDDLLHRNWQSLFVDLPGAVSHLAVGETCEAGLRKRDGSTLPVLLVGAYSIAGAGGLMFVLDRGKSARDHIEVELARKEISRNERRLSEAQQMANVGSWELEFASKVVTWSEQLFHMYGFDPALTTPSYEAFQSVLHADDRDAVVKRINDAWARGVPVEYDYRIVRPDGTQRHMHSRNEVVHDARGTPVRLIGTVQDITEHKRAERALLDSETRLLHAQKMEAVGRLAGGVAHDFNNLLTAIIGYAQLADRQIDPANGAHADLDQIRRAADRAACLTRQLLAFSRKQVLAPRQILLGTVIKDLEPMLRVLIGEEVVLSSSFDEGKAHVFADPGQLEQVIMNLAVNGRDAMPGGGILTLTTRVVELDGNKDIPPGPYVELVVGDTGVGMPPEILGHLFEPFFTTKEAGSGTGLGLATVYGIIKQSGGYIEVESGPGLGSRFRILLPQVDMSCDDTAIEAMDLKLRGHETLLVVEDDTRVRAVARRMLELAGYNVLEAANGMDAMKVAAGHSGPIHLMVTDVVMLGLNGREVADRITLDRPSTRVLYMSGYTDDASVLRAVLNSGVPFLHKPFTHETLIRRVREVLDRRD